jgi:hypothetical protein
MNLMKARITLWVQDQVALQKHLIQASDNLKDGNK